MYTIRKKRVHVIGGTDWRNAFVRELVEFPSQFDDQVDAVTQYLDWTSVNAIPDLPPKRAFMVGATSLGLPLETTGTSAITSGRGMVVGRYHR